MLRDLKRIHSHICSVAYPVLEAAGELPRRESVEADLCRSSPTKVRRNRAYDPEHFNLTGNQNRGVIPGASFASEPGIHNHRREYGFRACA